MATKPKKPVGSSIASKAKTAQTKAVKSKSKPVSKSNYPYETMEYRVDTRKRSDIDKNFWNQFIKQK